MITQTALLRTILCVAVSVFIPSVVCRASPETDIAAANQLFTAGQFDQASTIAAQVLASDPDDYEAILLQGRVALLGNHLGDAKKWLSEAIKLRPTELRPKLLLAEAYRRTDDFADAAPLYAAAGNPARSAFSQMLKENRAYDIHGNDRTSVRLVQTDPLPVLQVTVDGKRTVNFLIDTGAPEVIVDPDFADSLGIKPQGAETGTFGGGKQGELQFAKLDSLKVGTFLIKNVPVEVLPTKQFSAIDGGKPIEGVIGTVLLYHFLATINYPGGQLILQKINRQNITRMTKYVSDTKSISVPFWLAGDHYMVAWGTVNDTAPQLMLCDTGLEGLSFTAPDSTLKLAGIKPMANQAQVGQGGGGDFSAAPIRISKLTFGAVEERDVDGVSGAFPPSLENSLGFHLGGLVSHAFFSRYAVTFDFADMRIYLSPSQGAGY